VSRASSCSRIWNAILRIAISIEPLLEGLLPSMLSAAFGIYWQSSPLGTGTDKEVEEILGIPREE